MHTHAIIDVHETDRQTNKERAKAKESKRKRNREQKKRVIKIRKVNEY